MLALTFHASTCKIITHKHDITLWSKCLLAFAQLVHPVLLAICMGVHHLIVFTHHSFHHFLLALQ